MRRTVTVDRLSFWSAEIESACALADPLFARKESRAHAREYVRGLLSGGSRPTSWQLAQQAGSGSPDSFQWLLTGAPWSAAALRDLVRDYVVERFGSPGATLAVAEAGFPKKGGSSAGVARQYSSVSRRTEHCQLGVFLVYASPRGSALIDRDLFLPRREWVADAGRRARAGIPANVDYATGGELAARMLDRAAAAGVPFRWVSAPRGYGNVPALHDRCLALGVPSVLEVTGDHTLALGPGEPPQRVRDLADRVPPAAYERIPAGGPAGVGSEWTALWLAEPDRPGADGSGASDRSGRPADRLDRVLLVHRDAGDPGQRAYYVCHVAAGTVLAELVTVALTTTDAAACLARATAEVGLGRYTVRRWDSWYRHITLSMFAWAVLTALRAEGVPTDLL